MAHSAAMLVATAAVLALLIAASLPTAALAFLYDYGSCGSGNHGLDCNCPADTTSTTTVALATTVTFDHATDTFQLTLSGALNRPQRTINTVRLGDSSGGSCFSVPQHYWSCDGSCTCIVTVSLDEYSTTCSPVEADLGDGKTGFTVFATVEGQDTHTTGTFGQTLTTPEVVVLSATASTTVTTRQIVIEAVGINQGITSVRVDSVTIIPRSPNSGDVDAELEIVVTLVTPGDLDGVSAQGTYFNGLSAGVALVTEWPHWWSLCGFDITETCSHTTTIVLTSGDLTTGASCDFSGGFHLLAAADGSAPCWAAGSCTEPFDIDFYVLESHPAEVCNPSQDDFAVASTLSPGPSNPPAIITLPGETAIANWDSKVQVDGVDVESTLSSIVAAVLSAGEACDTDLASNPRAVEVYDNTDTGYVDINTIFSVTGDTVSSSITLTLDSSIETAQTLHDMATDKAAFEASYAGTFCFVLTREAIFVDLPDQQPQLRVLTAGSSGTSARTSASVPLELKGVDLAANEQAQGTNDGAGAIRQAQAGAGTIVIVTVVVACVALAAVAVFVAIKVTRRGDNSSATVLKPAKVTVAPAAKVEPELEEGTSAAPPAAWTEE